MDFLSAVTRILLTNSILRGDDVDGIATFSDVAHGATISLAKVAIQSELNQLIADSFIPYEFGTGTITTDSSNRTYLLATDFGRFFGDPARLYYSAGNRYITEIDRNDLSLFAYRYQLDTGEPNWFYFEPGTTKRIAFWQRPTSALTYTYDYEKSLTVTDEGDLIPLTDEPQSQVFCEMAGRRFKALFEERPDPVSFILKDPTYLTARATLAGLRKMRNPSRRYAATYR